MKMWKQYTGELDKYTKKLVVMQFHAPPWSAAAWRCFGIDDAQPRPKRRQAAALQGGAQFEVY